MNVNQPIIHFTAKTRKDTVLQEAPSDMQSLVSRLSISQTIPYTHDAYIKLTKAQQDNLKDVGGYILGRLKDGRRKAGSILSRSAAVIDADNIPSGQLEAALRAMAGLELCYVVYSTAKHSPASPRLRIVIFFAKEIEADKYAPAVRQLCRCIQPDMTWFDPSTDEAGRLMYWASHCQDVEPVFVWGEGRGLLDADALLEQLPDWRDPSCWPRFPREQAPARLAAKQEDPTSKSGVVGAFCRVYDMPAAMDKFLPGVYEHTDQLDRYTFAAGSTSGGALVYEDGKFIFSHHATDPAGGKLLNAFDLVRLHKFGALDDEAKEGTRGNRRPSYAAMCELARADAQVSDMLAREAFSAAAEESSLGEEDATLELGRCAGENLSLEIVRLALRAFGITAKNNLITGRAEITGLPGSYSKENAANTLPVFLVDKLRAIGVKGVNKAAIMDYLANIFDENRYNPVTDMLQNTTWDGVTRFPQLLQIMDVSAGSLEAELIRKWLIQCVALAFNSTERREAAEGVLTLQGPQGVGKTLLFRRLSIKSEWFVEGASLDLRNKDSIINAVSGWITELGELDSTLRRDQSSLKAFITLPADRIRAPYAREATFNPRRTSFCASVNPGEFLRDETGDRRFWVVPTGIIDARALLSFPNDWFMQLWAEARAQWAAKPEGFRLTRLEQQALDISNRKFRQPLPGEEEIRERLNFELPRGHWGEFSATDLLWGMRDKVDSRLIGKVLAKLAREDPRITKRVKNGYVLYRLPIPAGLSMIQPGVDNGGG